MGYSLVDAVPRNHSRKANEKGHAHSLTHSQILVPRETGWFGHFANDTTDSVVPIGADHQCWGCCLTSFAEETAMWKEDWIGLRTLQESGRLFRFTTTCEHQDYDSECFKKYFTLNALPHLVNTFA